MLTAPIEVVAERGLETLKHDCIKSMDLTNAYNPTVKVYALVQLRQDNKLGTLLQYGRLSNKTEIL